MWHIIAILCYTLATSLVVFMCLALAFPRSRARYWNGQFGAWVGRRLGLFRAE